VRKQTGSSQPGSSRTPSSTPSQRAMIPGPSLAAKQHGVITLVEIKYAPDPDMNGAVRKQAKDQHKDLRTSLLDQGWGTVNLYPVIIGNAGTITNTANDALQALGVDAATRMTLLKRLAVDSLRRTAEIWKPRLGQRTSRGAPPRPVPSPMPPGNPDAPGPIDPPVQQDDAPPNPAVEEHPDVADDHHPAPTLCQTLNTCRGKSSPGVVLDAQEQMPLQGQARPPKRCCMSRLDHRNGAAIGSQYWRAMTSCGPSPRMLSHHVAPTIHLSPLRMRLLRPAHASILLALNPHSRLNLTLRTALLPRSLL